VSVPAPQRNFPPADVENETKGLAMRSSITSVLLAGAFALAGASATFAATDTSVTVTTGDQSTAASIDYKAEREKCKTLPGSDQARCMDSVGITTYNGEREGTVTDEMGSLQNGDRCDTLSPADRRDCLLNDKGH
jgi:hypothetical protein